MAASPATMIADGRGYLTYPAPGGPLAARWMQSKSATTASERAAVMLSDEVTIHKGEERTSRLTCRAWNSFYAVCSRQVVVWPSISHNGALWMP
jgi:hypothetical protein